MGNWNRDIAESESRQEGSLDWKFAVDSVLSNNIVCYLFFCSFVVSVLCGFNDSLSKTKVSRPERFFIMFLTLDHRASIGEKFKSIAFVMGQM